MSEEHSTTMISLPVFYDTDAGKRKIVMVQRSIRSAPVAELTPVYSQRGRFGSVNRVVETSAGVFSTRKEFGHYSCLRGDFDRSLADLNKVFERGWSDQERKRWFSGGIKAYLRDLGVFDIADGAYPTGDAIQVEADVDERDQAALARRMEAVEKALDRLLLVGTQLFQKCSMLLAVPGWTWAEDHATEIEPLVHLGWFGQGSHSFYSFHIDEIEDGFDYLEEAAGFRPRLNAVDEGDPFRLRLPQGEEVNRLADGFLSWILSMGAGCRVADLAPEMVDLIVSARELMTARYPAAAQKIAAGYAGPPSHFYGLGDPAPLDDFVGDLETIVEATLAAQSAWSIRTNESRHFRFAARRLIERELPRIRREMRFDPMDEEVAQMVL